jgi:hypothetical protein
VQVFEKHICACDAIGISTVFLFFFQLAWFSLTNLLFGMWLLSVVSLLDTFDMVFHNVFIMFHQEALPHPSWTLFQPEVHNKCDHISKMMLRANQAFFLISASEDRLGKHAEGWKNMVFMYILGDSSLRTAWMFAQILHQLVEIIYTHCWRWWSQWVSHGSVLICRSSMERCALYGMTQQGAVASWVLLFEVLHMLQK